MKKFWKSHLDRTQMAALMAYLDAKHLDIHGLAKALDVLSPKARLDWMSQLTPSDQAKLFEAALETDPLSIDDIVPPNIEFYQEVIAAGVNTLPIYRHFEKRFCRLPEGELAGYNAQSLIQITGPGYFTAFDDPSRGEVIIDYRRLPKAKSPHWPSIIPNEKKLGRWVYANMVDRLRRLSKDVFIGRAFRREAPMNAWFILNRLIPQNF